MKTVLCHLIFCNLCVLSVICDGIEEIPFIKKSLQENRKKIWTHYSKKLLFHCDKYHRNVLTMEANVDRLFKCANIQQNEVLKMAKRKLR